MPLSQSQIEAIIEWDVHTWAQAFPVWEAHLPDDLAGLKALEIGGRTGGLSLYLAGRGAEVLCTDLSDPRERAQDKHRRAGVAERIQYRQADVLKLPFQDDSFQLVAFKSVLGTLRTAENQERAIREIFRVLQPGGTVLFAENLPASPLHMVLRRLFTPWGAYWRYVTRQEVRSWCRDFSELHLASAGVLATFGRSERRRAWLAEMDRRWQDRLPQAWHYALFGVARK